jgi:hypothetical protein
VPFPFASSERVRDEPQRTRSSVSLSGYASRHPHQHPHLRRETQKALKKEKARIPRLGLAFSAAPHKAAEKNR